MPSRGTFCNRTIMRGRERARCSRCVVSAGSAGSIPARPAMMLRHREEYRGASSNLVRALSARWCRGSTLYVGWSFNGRIPRLHRGDEGSIPSRSTNCGLMFVGTCRSHKPDQAGFDSQIRNHGAVFQRQESRLSTGQSEFKSQQRHHGSLVKRHHYWFTPSHSEFESQAIHQLQPERS